MKKVGSLERTNPLPPGRYWVDVFGKNIPKADAWFRANQPFGIKVIGTQSFDIGESNPRNWYLFTAEIPTNGLSLAIWDTSLGYPTVADASITQSDDTVKREDPELDPLDRFGAWLNQLEQSIGGSIGGAARAVPWVVFGALGIGAVWALGGKKTVTKTYRKVTKSLKGK